MRRTMLVASFAAVACLGACGGGSDSASGDAVVVLPTPSPEPANVTPATVTATAEQPKSAPAARGQIRQALPRKDLD